MNMQTPGYHSKMCPEYVIIVFITYILSNYLTLYALMDSFFWFITINLGCFIVYIRGKRFDFPNKSYFLSQQTV